MRRRLQTFPKPEARLASPNGRQAALVPPVLRVRVPVKTSSAQKLDRALEIALTTTSAAHTANAFGSLGLVKTQLS